MSRRTGPNHWSLPCACWAAPRAVRCGRRWTAGKRTSATPRWCASTRPAGPCSPPPRASYGPGSRPRAARAWSTSPSTHGRNGRRSRPGRCGTCGVRAAPPSPAAGPVATPTAAASGSTRPSRTTPTAPGPTAWHHLPPRRQPHHRRTRLLLRPRRGGERPRRILRLGPGRPQRLPVRPLGSHHALHPRLARRRRRPHLPRRHPAHRPAPTDVRGTPRASSPNGTSTSAWPDSPSPRSARPQQAYASRFSTTAGLSTGRPDCQWRAAL
jgi:hypothetical protein